jgi:hypothetical protein
VKISLSVFLTLLVGVSVVCAPMTVLANKVKYKKVQEVDFEASDVDGQVRNPDGAYLLQKRGVDFLPLYKVRSGFDENIKESIEHLR